MNPFFINDNQSNEKVIAKELQYKEDEVKDDKYRNASVRLGKKAYVSEYITIETSQ